jgi:hypothetical protein
LQTPRNEEISKTETVVEKSPNKDAPEQNPSHFAPENPTNRELVKERWYTRAAWASIVIGYAAGLASIPFADGEIITGGSTRGLLIDTVFAYWALRNSELRKFILEGSVLPNPAHSDKFIRTLLGLGAACNFGATFTSGSMSVYQLALGNYITAAITAGSAIGSLHIGAAWVRRIRFFSAINSQ